MSFVCALATNERLPCTRRPTSALTISLTGTASSSLSQGAEVSVQVYSNCAAGSIGSVASLKPTDAASSVK